MYFSPQNKLKWSTVLLKQNPGQKSPRKPHSGESLIQTPNYFSIKRKRMQIEMQVKTVRRHSKPIWLAKSMLTPSSFAKDIDPPDLLLIAGGSVNWYKYFGKVCTR